MRIKRIKRQCEFKISMCWKDSSGGKILLRPSANYNKLLGRVAF